MFFFFFLPPGSHTRGFFLIQGKRRAINLCSVDDFHSPLDIFLQISPFLVSPGGQTRLILTLLNNGHQSHEFQLLEDQPDAKNQEKLISQLLNLRVSVITVSYRIHFYIYIRCMSKVGRQTGQHFWDSGKAETTE